MPQNKARVRFDYLDIAKAITIFLVIMGHTTGNLEKPFFRLVLYAFHMPLFFMVSGVVTRRHRTTGYGWKHWLDFLRKNVLAIAVPYLIWSIAMSNFSFQNLLYIFYGSWERLADAQTVTSFWFLPCLFFARIFMELVLMSAGLFPKLNRHLYAAIVSVPSFAIGFLLPKLEHGYPWCINISFVALGFMLIGYSLKSVIASLYRKNILLHILLLAVSLASFAALMVLQRNDLYLVLMCGSDYGDPLLFFANAFTGCGIILSASVILSKLWENHSESKIRRTVLWIGQNTIGIFLIHKPFLQQVVIAGFAKLGFTQASVPLAFFATVITLPVCCALILVIDRYIPQLFGKFPNPKKLAVKESLEAEIARTAQEDETLLIPETAEAAVKG